MQVVKFQSVRRIPFICINEGLMRGAVDLVRKAFVL